MLDDLSALVSRRLEAARQVQDRLPEHADLIARIAEVVTKTLSTDGGKVLFCGNGGSAADALHLACELSGRFYLDRRPLPALALAANVPALTAIGNDYGFEEVFARQVRGLGAKGDALIAISTSGNSPNVVAALKAATEKGMVRIAFTGRSGGAAAAEADYCFRAPADETPRIQEAHILVGHIVCEIVENALFGPQ